MSELVKTFMIDGQGYNVARASAEQQDEILSMLTGDIVQRLEALASTAAAADQPYDKPYGDDFGFNFFNSLPFQVKRRFDELLLTQMTRSGEQMKLTVRDFDGKLMALNKLRGEALVWNLLPFFEYWASGIKEGLDRLKATIQEIQR